MSPVVSVVLTWGTNSSGTGETTVVVLGDAGGVETRGIVVVWSTSTFLGQGSVALSFSSSSNVTTEIS